MIIQCEQCQTRFKLDDAKVTEKGVKVRCAKCKHVFTVRKQEPVPEASASGALTATAPAAGLQAAGVQPTPPSALEAEPSFSFGDDTPEPAAKNDLPDQSGPFGSALADSAPSADFTEPAGFSLPAEETTFALEPGQKPSLPDEVSFGDFDFGDTPDDSDSTINKAPAAAHAAGTEEAPGLDFSDDDMFGTVVQPPAEEPDDAINFDFGTDSFADSLDMGDSTVAQTGSAGAGESSGDAPFSLGEIDFGEELTAVAVQQVNPDELKPSQEILFAPLAEAQVKAPQDDALKKAFAEELGADQDDLPPLPIASRRKQSPLFTGLIAAAALLAVGALGYFGLSSFSTDKTTVAQENGRIGVRSIKASYLQNRAVGTLLVISGEALNEYSKPRAALQVKASMLDAAGQVLVSKSAYCGNLLNDEQLTTLPLENIEAAMNNQFGDSLANLEVAPGKTVPFTIVIANPPKEGRDFTVEPVGSTVATGKQQ